jgi:DnaK suppressor protein
MNTTITVMQTETSRRKAVLEAKLKELLGQSDERNELKIEPLADPADQVRSSADRDLAVHRLDTRARAIQEIRAALQRIDEKVYGLCEDCEEPIGNRRLDAVPWARLCVNCQTKRESKEYTGDIEFDHAA